MPCTINKIPPFPLPGPDRPAAGGREARAAVGGEDAAQHDQEPRRGPAGGGREPAGQALGQLLHAGMNCIKIGLPAKLILIKRKGLLEVLSL